MSSNCQEIADYVIGCIIVIHIMMSMFACITEWYFYREGQNCHISCFLHLFLRNVALVKCINKAYKKF